MNYEESDKKTDVKVCVKPKPTATATATNSTNTVAPAAATTTSTTSSGSAPTAAKNSKNKSSRSSVSSSHHSVGSCVSSSGGSNSSGVRGGSGNASGKNMSTTATATTSTTATVAAAAVQKSQQNSNSNSSAAKNAVNSQKSGACTTSSSAGPPQAVGSTAGMPAGVASTTATATPTTLHHQRPQQQNPISLEAAAEAVAAAASAASSSAKPVNFHSFPPLENMVRNSKFPPDGGSASASSSTTDTIPDPFAATVAATTEHLQTRGVTDLSESDEESVSEILLACLCLRPDLLDEIPDSGSESCGNDVDGNDDEDDGDDEDEDEDDEGREANEENFLLHNTAADHSRKLTELFEAAANDKTVLRHATLAIDEATQALTKMRGANSPKEKAIFSRTLIAACNDNDVTTVRQLLGKNSNIPINESTEDGESLLSMACSAGYYELAQVLLAMSAAQVEDKGQKECTPLMEAASAGHVDIIRLLISHNADVNAQCATGNTPLMFACAGGHVEAVKELLKHGANVEDQNENGHTPLMEAASAGHVEVAKVLLEHGAGINTHSNEFKESALTLACYKGHLNMVRFLLQAGADQEHKTDEMHTALMEASMDGHVEVARLLLDSGAQVNMPTDSFESPLTLAACGGHVELATLLIERGANIEEVNDEGYTPLMEAAREGHEDMVALLLSKGANINATTEETQETALTLACCGGFMEVAEFLIKQGADLELGASTPLMEAAQEGHTDLVRYLLENGANVHAQTQTGDTALTHACENGHTDAAEVLLYYGAELEHESEGGRTPLMKACRAGHLCTVKFLISKGADVNKQTTNNDQTALSLACAGGHQQVVELLLKSGADPCHKLKDSSTMLIEAAKGGHIRVVETLFKYEQLAMNNQVQDATAAPAALNNDTRQLQTFNLPMQKPMQLTGPPGLHDVPEAVRVSNQQKILQQFFEDPLITNTPEGFVMDPNSRDLQQEQQQQQQQQNDPLYNKMRLFPMHAAAAAGGLEDGLAHGLSQPSFVNQILSHTKQHQSQQQQQQISNNTNNIATTNNNNNNNVNNNNTTNNQNNTSGNLTKQKSLLRKNRQAPVPFELNLTNSEVQQVRSQPLGEDDANSFYISAAKQQQQQRKMIEEFQKLDSSFQRANIQLTCDGNGPPSTLLPSAYVDLTTAPGQGGVNKAGHDPNNSFLLATSLPATIQASAASVAGVGSINSHHVTRIQPHMINVSASSTNAGAGPSSGVVGSSSSTTQTVTPTQITTPSEVSQSTAISDRPKVKPVSKKDGKNLRKAATTTVLQQNQMVSIYNNLPLLLTTEPSYQSHHQPVNDGSTILATMSGGVMPNVEHILNPPPSEQQSDNNGDSSEEPITTILQQRQILSAYDIKQHEDLYGNMITEMMASSASASSSSCDSAASSTTDHEEQLSKLPINCQWNRKVLQMVTQMPNYPLQIAQRLIDPQPKSPSETPPLGDDDNDNDTKTPDSPTKTATNFILEDTDYVDLPHVFHEAVHEFRTSDLNASEIVQVLQPISNLIPHKGGSLNNVQQRQLTIQQQPDKSQHGQSTYIAQEEHFHMFPVEDSDGEAIGDCGIYPALGESLESFSAEDEANREQICSYELGLSDCMEEILNVFQGDPTLQEIATNLNSEFTEYNSMQALCRNRWNPGPWMPTTSQLQEAELLRGNFCLSDDPNDQRQANQLTLEEKLMQHRFSVEDMQIINQYHSQQATLSLMPTTELEQQQQQPPNIGIQSLPAQSGLLQTQQQQQQSQSNATTSSANVSSPLVQANTTGIQQSQQSLQQQQQQQTLSGDAQQQTKFVFNVDADKPSQSLQLLFQLPGQTGPQQQTSTISAQQQQICPTSNLPHVPNTNAVRHHVQTQLSQQQQIQQLQHCAQHSQQVQVATQTQQQPAPGYVPAVARQFCASNTTLDGSNVTEQPTNLVKSTGNATGASKKSDKISRKERNKYTVMRQAPAGSQANTTQQYTPQGPVQSIEKTIDVDSETDSNHDTALTLACAGGHEELVELLINRGANIEHRDKKGFTPLILAATAGHEKVVDILLKHNADLEAQSERTKDTPLSLACSGGRYEVVELLLNVGANKEHRNVSDYTPLSLAASGGYVNIIKLLLNHGAEINSRTGSKLGISPLMLAAMNGHTAAVKLLLDMGSDINAQIETNRNTALTLACFQGRHEVVSLLLDRKANVEHRAKTGLTPLMEAASGGYIEVGRVLLDKGADVNAAPVPTSRDTALTIAADKGHLKFVELLLSRGAAVEVKNRKGNSPLWLAAHGGHLAVVEVLSGHGADIDSQDNRRVSCLMAAFRKGHTKVVKWMVQHVTQFPSDQEMTRFINTISDKELLEKCYDCVKIIRAAKEAQAVKANKNASILLEELDMERTREESRRAAAARRRERKKKKKLEKKEEKRKMMENNSVEPQAAEKESEKEEDSEKEEENVELNQNHDREEGDSGIDQGSCSSTDMKTNNGQADKNSKTKNKKKQKNQNQSGNVRGSNSPLLVQREEPQPQSSKQKKEEPIIGTKNKKEQPQQPSNTKNEVKKTNEKQPVEPAVTAKKEEPKKKDIISKDVSTRNKDKEKEKENLAPKDDTSKPPKIAEKKHENTSVTGGQMQKHHSTQETVQATPAAIAPATTNRKSLIFSARHPVDNSGSKLNANTKREDGWKEVVRKSSIQQQTVTTTSTSVPEIICKKVQVPVHAISRVIGRAGSNINAIRASTGAHIEVEKQGKAQSDRCITIKGSSDATKQAHYLITTLIKDPDVDILQMLPRPNIPSKSSPVVVNSWDKNSSSTFVEFTSNNPSTIANATQKASSKSSIQNPSLGSGGKISTPISAVGGGSTKSISSSSSRQPPGSKQGFIPPSQSSRSSSTQAHSSTSLGGATSRSAGGEKTSLISQIRASAAAMQSSDSLNSTTKTTMSYTNAIMSLKNVGPKPAGSSTSTHQSSQSQMQPIGTFASKLSGGSGSTEKKASQLSNQSHSQASSTSQGSASHVPNVGKSVTSFPSSSSSDDYYYGNMAPVGSRRPTNALGKNSASKQNYSGTFTSASSEATTNTSTSTSSSGRSITPIGPPSSANRNISSPSLQIAPPSSSSNIADCSAAVSASSSGVAAALSVSSSALSNQTPGLPQLPTKISQEYSLFNSSYSNQWDAKQSMYDPTENDSLPKADASKAPGYNRGNVMSSPVSSKTSSNSTTPPGSSVQTPGQQSQHLNILPVSAVSAATSPGGASHSNVAASQAGAISSQTAPEVYTTTPNDLNLSVLKPPSQAPIPPPPASGLAIQRPIMSNNSLQNRTNMALDNNYGPIGSSAIRDQNPASNSRSYFDPMNNPTLNQHSIGSFSDPMSQQYHPVGINVNQGNPLQLSRLNPRASVFSQQNKSSQQLGGMFHQSSSNIGLSNYQKLPTVGNQNTVPPYNQPPPGRPQSQPQAGSNARWFSNDPSGYSGYGMPTARDMLNLENGMPNMSSGSPAAMSPNNPQQPQTNGIISNQPPNQPPPPIGSGGEDNRKMPRPIGTERASWKYNHYPNMNLVEPEQNIAVTAAAAAAAAVTGPLPPWVMDKSQAQPPAMQQNWQKSHQRFYVGDMHQQDHFHIMDYHNVVPPPTVNSTLNLMQPLQYPHFIGHAGDMAPMTEKIELWEQENHGWSSNWTN
ncbi:ankyrin repeat and KH domain-containing protein mask isoform X3 [Hermetia illucens]|uniref:ankyrin repeat and KH domain-containing protein mask isoform X3 n=1 Tax=Hermetia illucens TaxID=343691 RepID=UPI0018CC40A7|nr:ankyrin repeat and KH domain-containing protein mask isoform X3 [Hermetia illucens]